MYSFIVEYKLSCESEYKKKTLLLKIQRKTYYVNTDVGSTITRLKNNAERYSQVYILRGLQFLLW